MHNLLLTILSAIDMILFVFVQSLTNLHVLPLHSTLVIVVFCLFLLLGVVVLLVAVGVLQLHSGRDRLYLIRAHQRFGRPEQCNPTTKVQKTNNNNNNTKK